MTVCSSCGAAVATGDSFCGGCGQPVQLSDAGPPSGGDDPAAIDRPPRPGATLGASIDLPPPPQRPPSPPVRAHGAGGGSDPRGVVIAAADHDSELEGQAVPNQFYVGQRLGYKDGGAENLDPVNLRFALGLLMHWAAVFFIFVVGGAVIFVVGRILGSTKLAGILDFFWWLAVGIVAWWFPVWVSISEWKFMVNGKAAASGAAFQHITSVFERRQSPVDRLKVHRLSLGRSQSREYLYVQDGVFRAYVACFPFGHDLYVGWTMWWRLSAVRWFWTIIKRYYQAFTLRGSELHQVHRYDSAKALREAVHGAAREGLDAAAGLVRPDGTGTAGSSIAVEDLGAMEDLDRPWSGLSRAQPT